MAVRKISSGGTNVYQSEVSSPAIQKTQKGKVIYRLCDGSKPERYILKTSGHIGVDDDGQKRFMRLSRMSSTIWLEEQPDNITIEGLQFERGEMILDPSMDRMAMEFMKRSENNIENGGSLFFVYNPVEAASVVVSKEEAIIGAKALIMSKFLTPEGEDEIRFVCKALRIGDKTTPKEILKQALYSFAERDAKKLTEAFNDKSIKALALIYTAEEKREIVYDGSVVRFAGGSEIMKIPQGRPWREYLAEFISHPDQIELLKEFDSIANAKPKKEVKKF